MSDTQNPPILPQLAHYLTAKITELSRGPKARRVTVLIKQKRPDGSLEDASLWTPSMLTGHRSSEFQIGITTNNRPFWQPYATLEITPKSEDVEYKTSIAKDLVTESIDKPSIVYMSLHPSTNKSANEHEVLTRLKRSVDYLDLAGRMHAHIQQQMQTQDTSQTVKQKGGRS